MAAPQDFDIEMDYGGVSPKGTEAYPRTAVIEDFVKTLKEMIAVPEEYEMDGMNKKIKDEEHLDEEKRRKYIEDILSLLEKDDGGVYLKRRGTPVRTSVIKETSSPQQPGMLMSLDNKIPKDYDVVGVGEAAMAAVTEDLLRTQKGRMVVPQDVEMEDQIAADGRLNAGGTRTRVMRERAKQTKLDEDQKELGNVLDANDEAKMHRVQDEMRAFLARQYQYDTTVIDGPQEDIDESNERFGEVSYEDYMTSDYVKAKLRDDFHHQLLSNQEYEYICDDYDDRDLRRKPSQEELYLVDGTAGGIRLRDDGLGLDNFSGGTAMQKERQAREEEIATRMYLHWMNQQMQQGIPSLSSDIIYADHMTDEEMSGRQLYTEDDQDISSMKQPSQKLIGSQSKSPPIRLALIGFPENEPERIVARGYLTIDKDFTSFGMNREISKGLRCVVCQNQIKSENPNLSYGVDDDSIRELLRHLSGMKSMDTGRRKNTKFHAPFLSPDAIEVFKDPYHQQSIHYECFAHRAIEHVEDSDAESKTTANTEVPSMFLNDYEAYHHVNESNAFESLPYETDSSSLLDDEDLLSILSDEFCSSQESDLVNGKISKEILRQAPKILSFGIMSHVNVEVTSQSLLDCEWISDMSDWDIDALSGRSSSSWSGISLTDINDG